MRINIGFSLLYLWSTWGRLVPDLPPAVLQQSPSHQHKSQLKAQYLGFGDGPPSLSGCENRVPLCEPQAATKQQVESRLCCWPMAFLLHLFTAPFLQGQCCFQKGEESGDPASITKH